jgi:hypothetical protein
MNDAKERKQDDGKIENDHGDMDDFIQGNVSMRKQKKKIERPKMNHEENQSHPQPVGWVCSHASAHFSSGDFNTEGKNSTLERV